MLVFTPKEIDIHLLDNVREKKKDIISLVKNSIPDYYDKKKYTFYTTKEKIVCITFDDALPILDIKDKRVPIYNLCRLLLEENTENTYSIFCFEEYKLCLVFKDDLLITYKTDLKDVDDYAFQRKKEFNATDSKSTVFIYSDENFKNLDIKEIIDFNRKEVLSKLEKNDILIKKSPIVKILSKIDIKFSLTEFLIKASGFITLLLMLFYFISSNKELNNNIKEMMTMKQEIKDATILFKEIKTDLELIKTSLNNTTLSDNISAISKQNEQTKQDFFTSISTINTNVENLNLNVNSLMNKLNDTSNNMSIQPNNNVSNPNVVTPQQEQDKKQTREEFSQEVDGYSFKVKAQNDTLMILSIGSTDYRLTSLVPLKIRTFQAVYSPKTNSVIFMNKDGLKIGYDVINYKLYLQI